MGVDSLFTIHTECATAHGKCYCWVFKTNILHPTQNFQTTIHEQHFDLTLPPKNRKPNFLSFKKEKKKEFERSKKFSKQII
jgi:hypothetical protein